MSRLRHKRTRSLSSAQVRQAVRQAVLPHVPLKIKGRALDDELIWDILMYAASHGLTIEGATQALASVPSGTTVRDHLRRALGQTRTDVERLQTQLTCALQHRLPRRLRRLMRHFAFEVAVDLVEVPYHGQPALELAEVRRGRGRAGTTHFHGYATLSIVHHQLRYELALTFVWKGEEMAAVLERLLAAVKPLGLHIQRLYADKAFATIAVLRSLRRRRIPHIIPLPLKGKANGKRPNALRALCVGRASHWAYYTFRAGTRQAYTIRVALVRAYDKRKRRMAWYAYAVEGTAGLSPVRRVHRFYAHRFGIETGYRQLHLARIRTTSRNPVLRLLLVGLAVLLVNIYLTLRQAWLTTRRYGSRLRYLKLTFKRLLHLLTRVIERLLPVRPLQERTTCWLLEA